MLNRHRPLPVCLVHGGTGALGALVALVLVAAWARPALSQANDPGEGGIPWEPPAEVIQHVKARLAAQWNVPTRSLHLEWSRPRAGTVLSRAERVELLGNGRNGRWMVSVHLPGSEREVVSLPLRAGIRRNQPFARVSLPRGAILTSANMEFLPSVHWGPLDDAPPAPDSGWVARRRIQAGELLTPPGVQPPLLVVSGQPVHLVWKSESLTISLQGTAVGSASLGETVFVRTNEGHRMSGTVTGAATVLLSNPASGGR